MLSSIQSTWRMSHKAPLLNKLPVVGFQRVLLVESLVEGKNVIEKDA